MFFEFFANYCLQGTPESPVRRINCSALPDKLIEMELFGYEKGSHSQADQTKDGLFETVKDGVLILEEIGEMPLPVQAKLLIAIENREFFKLGGTDPIPFNAHIVATTNAAKENFRADFWYRFAHFEVPPLHKRRKDILYYIENYDKELLSLLTEGVTLSLLAHNWPGNIRELHSFCDVVRENMELYKENAKTFILKKKLNESDRIRSLFADKAPLTYFHDDDATQVGSVLYTHMRRKESTRGKGAMEEWINETSDHTDDILESYQKTKANDPMQFAFTTTDSLTKPDLEEPMHVAREITAKGYELDRIENILKGYGLSLSYYSSKTFGAHNEFTPTWKEISSDKGTFINIANDSFDKTFSGLQIFCKLFFQDISSDKNLLEMSSPEPYSPPNPNRDIRLPKWTRTKGSTEKKIRYNDYIYQSALEDLKNWKQDYKEAMLECTRFLTDMRELTIQDITSLDEVFLRNPENEFLCSYFSTVTPTIKYNEKPIQSVSLDEIQMLYYETVMAAIGTGHGRLKRIADIAKRNPSTITNNFKEGAKHEKLGKQNFIPKKRLFIIAH